MSYKTTIINDDMLSRINARQYAHFDDAQLRNLVEQAEQQKDNTRANQARSELSRRALLAKKGSETKTCPQCAEEVKKDAKMCMHCGYKFS